MDTTTFDMERKFFFNNKTNVQHSDIRSVMMKYALNAFEMWWSKNIGRWPRPTIVGTFTVYDVHRDSPWNERNVSQRLLVDYVSSREWRNSGIKY